MNRRDFIRLSPLALLCGAFTPQPQSFDLQSLFNNSQEGDVIEIPSGLHIVNNTLYPKSFQVINGNNALILGNFNAPLFDFTGAGRATINNLRTHNDCTTTTAVLLSRTEGASNGAGNVFRNCIFDGSFSEACVVVRSEGNTFSNCEFITRNESPNVIYEGLNVTGNWERCAFRNYSELSNVGLIKLNSGAGLNFRDNYYFVGNNGTAFQSNGSVTSVMIDGGRVEGVGNCLLIDNLQTLNLYQWNVNRISYTPSSDYVIRSNGHLHEWIMDFMTDCRATKYKGGTGMVWRCRVFGNKPEIGSSVRMSHLTWTKYNPLPNGVIDNIVEWTP